ncbi:hypothetical protein [Bradyrhizobium sp.]|uniref:hypothetical protein n=1 Tax=Bradyrhizobium sp. TaxID=376 RepID=UPI001DDC18D2|nr:hypothetical protein [Bradyrhizobium sp.]MBV8698568.1 hypothetical protein [Bradyrhizobium sp.]MBV8920766.1 hypothetical protein [Bradyrhizobium sp.]MBV9982741.1 hypothetical protein [Bradyrhizobium sp.]
MTSLRLMSTGLMAVAMLATPAMARIHHHANQPRLHVSASGSAAPIDLGGGRLCYPAPRIGAFATAPWTGDNIPCEPSPGM